MPRLFRKALSKALKSCALILLASFALAPAARAGDLEFSYRSSVTPVSLDWSYKRAYFEIDAVFNIMEGLIDVDDDFNPVPALAEKWDVKDFGQEISFTLRKDVKWSDGKPLRARDFLFAWKRLLAPATKSEYASYLFDIIGAENFSKGKTTDFSTVGIKAPDDQHLIVRLRRGNPLFLKLLYFYVTFPQREDLVEKHPKDWWKPGKLVTLGAYRLVSIDKDKEMVFVANPAYYGKTPQAKTVRALASKNADDSRDKMDRGLLDVVFGMTSADVVRFTGKAQNPWLLQQFDAVNTAFLGMNISKTLKNPMLRKAIARAIDVTAIPKKFEDNKTPADSLIPKNIFGYESVALAHDPGLAQSELAHFQGADAGRKIKLNFIFRANQFDKIATFLKEQIEKALPSIQIETHAIDSAQLAQKYKAGAYDLYLDSWWADYYPDMSGFMNLMKSSSQFNRSFWKNAAYDKLVNEAELSTNTVDRVTLYRKAQHILVADEAVIVPLYHTRTVVLSSPKILSIKMSPFLSHFFFKNVKLKN